MANIQRNFIAGRMNKSLDERLVPNGEYIDALNVRLGSTEQSEIGSVENSKGNTKVTSLQYIDGTALSSSARCIGAIEDGSRETIYWFIHDSNFSLGDTGKLDMVVSYNTNTQNLTYHIVSIDSGDGVTTTLNFDSQYLITGINIIDDLLFFTDDLNPPRFINIKRNYPNPVTNIDQFSDESIMVIKRPPIEAPTIQPIKTGDQDTFLEDRFICFAYRYRYEDGGYSATSQFSEPSFVPKPFNFSYNSYLNEGMQNSTNSSIITFNSGGPLVVGIDLLFKEAQTPTIKVIQKLNKSELGYSDNTDYTYTFTNSKIFTVLPDSEILRLYDNVPKLAKAQTVMANRLVYGNYVDGNNMVDANGNKTRFEYKTSLISEVIGETDLPDTTEGGAYNIGGIGKYVQNAIVFFDLDGVELVQGSSITFDVRLSHIDFAGDTPFPDETTVDIEVSFNYVLLSDYDSVYELATDSDFIEKIGNASNIQTVADACNGTTLTDQVNCLLPNNLDSLTKLASGIYDDGEPIQVITNPASTRIGLQFQAMRYVDNVTTPTQDVYEYYSVVFAEGYYQKVSNTRSLHSNRGYEIGIVYMDEFNRASTALVSPDNTIKIPCSNSSNKNSIQVSIPTTQVAPSWASRYKFVIKPDEDTYDTIYSNIFFEDPTSNAAYFLLEGENAAKIEQGDRLVVKRDSVGEMQNCVYATVLEKESQAANFLEIPSEIQPDPAPDTPVLLPIPAGVYMKINPSNFTVIQEENSVIALGQKTRDENAKDKFPILAYPMNIEDPSNPGNYIDYTVPSGSRIVMKIKQQRLGTGDGNNSCERRIYTLGEITLSSSEDYDNMFDWFNGDNISNILDDGIQNVGANDEGISNSYDQTLATGTSNPPNSLAAPGNSIISVAGATNYYRFYRNTTTNQLFLLVTGTRRCSGIGQNSKRRSTVQAEFTVYRADRTLVFESEPADALPDVWYENNLSFPITPTGEHGGNVQNQDFTLNKPAIVNTEFFNCFAFGNGAESYKIRDSISGKYFNLGNRIFSTSNIEYKEADRFADLTYSGVYNDESNVNKLNEFNLGLLNFKPLEDIFGPIEMLFARETDILTLQEDKISYVLAGKNLLTDSTGGSAVTSVPEVLGTQIARLENFGISSNPESFSSWGYDKFFTDAKRGAVLRLRGASYKSDELTVISQEGMRSWFRDTFIESFKTQKLGAFDPYMNEYVLSSNENLIPVIDECINCGISKNITLNSSKDFTYCVDLSEVVGDVDVDYVIPFEGLDNIVTELSADDIQTESGEDVVTEVAQTGTGYTISVTYNGNVYTTGEVFTSGTLTFPKNSVSATEAQITVSTTNTQDDTVQVTVGCPQADEITIFNVCITSDNNAGKYIHNEYRWKEGTFNSPLHSNLVTFASGDESPLVSQYTSVTGPQGAGIIPNDGATVTIYSNKIDFDDFVFNTDKNKLKYIRTNTLYENNSSDMASLLSASAEATPIVADGTTYSANFTMPVSGQYLYLVWDYRESTAATLCYSDVSTFDACCDCSVPVPVPVPSPTVVGTCRFVFVENGVDGSRYGLRYKPPGGSVTDSLFNNLLGTPYTYGGDEGVVYGVCSTLSPSTWDSSTNTIVTISGVIELENGGSCTENTNCEYL